jgi:TIR domain
MAHDVFISYATEDRRLADAARRALEENGLRCWYAPRDVPLGIDYEEAIVDGIRGSRLVLLLLSTHSNRSPHVRREIQNAYADETVVPVLPVRVEEVALNKALRFYLSSVQWLDAAAPPFESHLPLLVEQLRARLARRDEGEEAEEAGPPAGGDAPPAGPNTPGPAAAGVGRNEAARPHVMQGPPAAPGYDNPAGGSPAGVAWPPPYTPPPTPPREPVAGPFPAPLLINIVSLLVIVGVLGARIATLRNPLPWASAALLVVSTPIFLLVETALYPLHLRLFGRPRRWVLCGAILLSLFGFIYCWSSYLKNSDDAASARELSLRHPAARPQPHVVRRR